MSLEGGYVDIGNNASMCGKRECVSREQVENGMNKVVSGAFANEVYEQVPIVCPMYPLYSTVAEHIRDTFWIPRYAQWSPDRMYISPDDDMLDLSYNFKP